MAVVVAPTAAVGAEVVRRAAAVVHGSMASAPCAVRRSLKKFARWWRARRLWQKLPTARTFPAKKNKNANVVVAHAGRVQKVSRRPFPRSVLMARRQKSVTIRLSPYPAHTPYGGYS